MTAHGELSADELRLPPLTDFLATTLRGLYLAFTKSPEGIPRSKDELVEALSPHVEESELSVLVSNLEATQTFRHLYVYAFKTNPNWDDLKAAISTLDQAGPLCLDQKTNLHYLGSCNYDYPLLRLAHPVKNSGYVQTGPQTKTLHTVWFRHPVIVAIKPDLGLVEIRFNGFDQTKDTPDDDRISYSDIATWCKQFVELFFNANLRGLPLKEPVEKLLGAYPEEVWTKKNVSLVGKARISLDVGDTDDDDNVHELITKAFALQESDTNPLKAMKSWTAENVTLFWSHFKAFTRIDYTGDAPEIMFSWKSAEYRSLRSHDQIMKRMVEFTDLDHSQILRKLALALNDADESDTLTVLDVSQRAGTSTNEAMEYLLQQVGSKRLRMMFRVKTSHHLLDAANSWVPSLGQLPRSVVTVEGESIDLTNPANVEVGFMPVEGR